MNFRGAVFDLDGTLLDSMDIWENIDIAFLKKRGLPVPSGYVTEICARSFIEAAEYTIDLFHLSESVDAIIHEWNEMAAYEYAHNVTLSPFAADYLRQLKHAGVKLAVATGLPQTLYEPCLKKNGIYELFDVLCSTDDMARGKEYPDIFVHCADRLGMAPEQCLVFEDVLPAVRSAKQAGMIVYGVFDKYSEHNMEEIKKIANGYLVDFHSAPLPAPRYGQMAELWDLYDITRKKTGAAVERGQTIPDGSYHLVVSVWIRNRHGEFLLSQRHPDKPYPLYWECTGGSVLAGESSLEGAVREAGRVGIGARTGAWPLAVSNTAREVPRLIRCLAVSCGHAGILLAAAGNRSDCSPVGENTKSNFDNSICITGEIAKTAEPVNGQDERRLCSGESLFI